MRATGTPMRRSLVMRPIRFTSVFFGYASAGRGSVEGSSLRSSLLRSLLSRSLMSDSIMSMAPGTEGCTVLLSPRRPSSGFEHGWLAADQVQLERLKLAAERFDQVERAHRVHAMAVDDLPFQRLEFAQVGLDQVERAGGAPCCVASTRITASYPSSRHRLPRTPFRSWTFARCCAPSSKIGCAGGPSPRSHGHFTGHWRAPCWRRAARSATPMAPTRWCSPAASSRTSFSCLYAGIDKWIQYY